MPWKMLATSLIVWFASWTFAAAASSAQSTASGIAGVVKDSSGVMPGVTVEAASPALIEKVRAVVTDGQGQFKIVDLRPGLYTVTFSLTGFNSVKREGVDLPPGFTATVNAELRVGTLEETITVSGEAPTVDVHNTKDQKVLSQEVLNALPTIRSPVGYVPYLPGVQGGLGQIGRDTASVTIHGNRALDSNVVIDGFETNSMAGSGGIGFMYYPNQGYVQELSVDVGGLSAEQQRSGIRTNIIPKTGGNTFSGFLFIGGGNSTTQADNLTPSLKASGLTAVNSLDRIWDINPAWGGPIVQDKLWFYNAYRYWGSSNFIAGLYYNATPTAWTYTPDRSRQAITRVTDASASLRLTWQTSPKAKIGLFYDTQPHCTCNRNFSSTVSPEATQWAPFVPNYFAQATWKYTATNRLLLDVGVSSSFGAWTARRQPGVAIDAVSATEQSNNLVYRAATSYSVNASNPVTIRSTATYVTGSHAVKFGISQKFGRYINTSDVGGSRTVRLLNGVPNQVTLFAVPSVIADNMNADLGIFAQDQWTVRHLTLNVGLRYDYFNGSVPAQDEAALLARFGLYNPPFTPVRSYPAIHDVPNWKDVSPRLGAVYDLFGDGKTAVKVALGRYVAGQAVEIATANNPITASVTNATRNWTDLNGNFVVDCDFSSPAATGECGPLSNLNFGQANPAATRYADAVIHGYGKRGYNWEGSVGVQRELAAGLSVSATYFRRWYGNFTVTLNTANSATDYKAYCITAPIDSRLPGGGGNQICGFYDVNPNKFGQVQNLIAQASDFGEQEDVYDGVDLTTNIRVPGGITLQGGLNIGRERTNNCFVLNQPQLSGLAGTPTMAASPNTTAFCDIWPPFQSQIKFFGVYPLPRWGLQTSATYQNLPGPQITASYVATNAQIAPSLGRNLSGGANSNATLNIIPPGTMYGARANELDVSIKKLVNVGHVRLSGGVDVFNLLNRSDVLSINNRFGPVWLQATNILTGRWVKVGAQLDF